MKKLGKMKTLTIASLSAVALAAPIAFRNQPEPLRTPSKQPANAMAVMVKAGVRVNAKGAEAGVANAAVACTA